MKAFFIDRYGKHSGMIGEVPDPAVGEHDVLIQVHATSMNPLDSTAEALRYVEQGRSKGKVTVTIK